MKKIEKLIENLNSICKEGREAIEEVFKKDSIEMFIILGSESKEVGYEIDDEDDEKTFVHHNGTTTEVIPGSNILPLRYAQGFKHMPEHKFVKMIGFCSHCYRGEMCKAISLARKLVENGRFVLISDRGVKTIYSPFGEWELKEGD